MRKGGLMEIAPPEGRVLFLGYRGISGISRMIRWQTRSVYSHVGVQLRNGTVVEAWWKGGVLHSRDFGEAHTEGTVVDFFEIRGMGEEEEERVERFLLGEVGKGYDFKGVLRFLSKREHRLDDRWFCSELAAEAIARAYKPILRGNPSEFSPRDFFMSMELEFVGRRRVGGGKEGGGWF